MGDDGFDFKWNDKGGKLEKAFWEFHDANPEIYIMLVKYAREWKRTHTHCSIKFLFERVRWQMGLTIQTDGFKLNNNHHAFYARMIEMLEEDLQGFFRMRQQRRQCSFGPRNSELPPGDHIA